MYLSYCVCYVWCLFDEDHMRLMGIYLWTLGHVTKIHASPGREDKDVLPPSLFDILIATTACRGYMTKLA